MIDIKVIKKPKNEGSTSALRTSGTAYGGMAVKEAAHAAKADIAELAKEAIHAKDSNHAIEADHSKEADHAVNADESKHALEADHAKEADNADKWDYHEFDDYLNQPVRKTDGVTFDSVTSDSIRSAGQFVDGMLGAGFQLWKGEDGRTYLTVDKLTVRQTMAVMELLIEKVRSVGGQICVSAANGRIKTVDESGEHYLITFEQENMFVQHDLVRCQTFTGKDMRSYWVEVTDVTEAGIVVAKEEFEGVEPKEGDECVLMGNTANTDRQNMVLISATEDGQPRVDVMDGVNDKTFANCLRARLGNLDGIKDDKFPADRQPRGNGLYADNAYMKGTFVLETGEDVKTRFEITEGKVQSAIDSVRNDFLSEKGYLNNPTFASGLEKWNSENETVFFLVGNRWIWANGAALSKKGDGASVVTDMGRKVVRIRNKYIRQKHENLRFVPTFPINDAGKKEALPVYLSFFYRCAKSGTLKIGFENVDKTGFADFNSMEVSEEIAATGGYVQYTCSGLWNGTGDFKLAFDGDIYLYMLVLSTDKIEALTYKYKTLFEQSERLVKISAAVYDKDERALQETGLMIQPEGTGIYIKDANGKLALIGVGVEETDVEGNKRTVIKLTADNIKLEGLVTANGYFKVKKDGSIECKGAKISGEVNATSGTFSGEVNATSGRFIGAIGAPYKIMSASSTLWPGVNTGMNIMISSADRATVGVVLPIYTEIDGVECDIINVCDTYTIITLPINVDIRDDTQPHIFYRNQKLTHVQLEGGCCRLRMKAFIKPGTEYCSWTILNTTDFQKVKSGTGVSYFVKSIIE
ncbi:hypothetical protein [uncultured Prevotella sp.]|uniref:hypothetical protein n=1 Tax=uncultured Prevotella sp. TaxID=159272 RepID=UPI0025952AC9|nr:hypothetical protein [uncultured Prevotella sp.]